MATNGEAIARLIGAVITYLVVVIGGLALFAMFDGVELTWFGMGLLAVIFVPMLWPVFAPLIFMMWGLDWNVMADAMNEANPPPKRSRRRR